MPRVYSPEPLARLHWREWDGQHVVYDDTTGHTHLLDDFGVWILEHLRESPCDVSTLTDAAAGEAGVERDPELMLHVRRTVGALCRAGLLRVGAG